MTRPGTTRRALALAFVACSLAALVAPTSVHAAEPAAVGIRLLQANIGNINVNPAGCNDQAVKLCLRPVEERLVASIRALDPDVVLLQEVLPTARCASTPATSPSLQNPNHLCNGYQSRRPLDQIDRLLPPERYETRCDDRFGWDCVGISRARGRIASFTTQPGTTLPGCDNGFTVNLAVLDIDGAPLQVTSAHPDSGGPRAGCRADKLRMMFDGLGGTTPTLPTVVSGDFNLDPYRTSDASVEVWDRFVGDPAADGTPYRYRSGVAEVPAGTDPPFSSNICGASAEDPTGLVPDGPQPRTPVCASTLDHVAATASVTGPCDTLGEAPGTSPRLDGIGGFDHRGIFCTFAIAAAGPAPVVPESPMALLLPFAAVVLLVARRRRRSSV